MPGFSVQSYIITIILILYRTIYLAGASLVVQWEIICLPMQVTHESQVQFLGWEDLLEKEMATLSNILAWEIPRTLEPGGLQFMESQASDIT